MIDRAKSRFSTLILQFDLTTMMDWTTLALSVVPDHFPPPLHLLRTVYRLALESRPT